MINTSFTSSQKQDHLSLCDYSTAYASIYDPSYGICFTFCDEDEFEDEGSWAFTVPLCCSCLNTNIIN